MRTTPKATAGMSALTPGSKPVFYRSGAWPRVVFFVAVIVCVLVPAFAIALADRYAREAVTTHERVVANDIVASVDRILDGARLRHADELTALVGRPCSTVFRTLAEVGTRLRYLRAVALVHDGRVTCSSALGAIDLPLDAYTREPAPGSMAVTLLRQTPFQHGIPVVAVFRATASGAGVLYLIEGDYVADALAHGAGNGAKAATLSIAGSGRLDQHGKFAPEADAAPAGGSTIASHRWPFTVSVTASARYASQVQRHYRLICATIVVLADGLVMAAYLLAMAPRRLLLKAVRQALRRNEFHVVYQPIVDVQTRRTVGVEALLRWHHPKWGAVSPAVFIPEVESSAVLPKITEFVLSTAVSELTALTPSVPLRIAVNVAPKDLERTKFVSIVEEAIHALPPGFTLVLEVTERILLEKNARTTEIFQALRSKGAKFAIDDFGTHHSNLDMLSRFPFDYVKIDRQFVAQLNGGGAGLIEGIAAVAHHYDLKIIAEGVETEAQHHALHAVGIQYAQGYLYQRPLRAEHLRRDFAWASA
ncbi:MAG: EAL domain-containing protein [Burkholderia sp.]|uniref:EAL domain-containing protein n=2 Tax=Burkholderiaceae TaxID=119060 RepID=UPI0015896B57|nr:MULTISPECIES: EAL domain-containing protein [Burkholderia]MCA3779040.1 EAL domain-containing protein [Burkholderia sp.]MCA3785055.1 EAL domain-containing protein [Burkholderia sp.]MCA3796645.1 EAL domain-containing protein [Burkholderia sp.]MCA3800236.1 EAL domain-containing protein [Burkholderia sp.]MCA3817059.1 EAL domain-containing protein [Burkholderia sp.]